MTQQEMFHMKIRCQCSSCYGTGHILYLNSGRDHDWVKCKVCVGTGYLEVKNPIKKLPPLQFSGNSPFPLAKD